MRLLKHGIFNKSLMVLALSLSSLSVLAETNIPMLEVQFDCGGCHPDEKIKALITGAYLDEVDRQKQLIIDETLPIAPNI